MRASILVRYSIGGETWLHDFMGIAVSYVSLIHFERISAVDTTECILGVVFFTWCIVKLYCYVTFCHACIIINIDNYIIHLGRQMILWSWVVCDVTIILAFSDHK